MKNDAEIVKAVQGSGTHRRRATENAETHLEKSASAEKAIHIPLPFDTVMSAVVKIKPEPKESAKRERAKKPSK